MDAHVLSERVGAGERLVAFCGEASKVKAFDHILDFTETTYQV